MKNTIFLTILVYTACGSCRRFGMRHAPSMSLLHYAPK